MSTPSDITPEALLAHSDWIRHLVAGLVRDPGRADDVLQETWLIALHRPPQENGNLRGWLASVARSVVQNLGRGEGRRKCREQAVARLEALPDTVDVIAKARLQGRMVDAVLGLDEPYRSSVLLRFFEDLPPREIAERMGRPVNTVRTHIARGLAQLRTELDAEFGDRESWGMAFLPLLWEGKKPLVSGTTLAKTSGGLMSLKWIAAALIALVSLLAWKQMQAHDSEQVPMQPMESITASQVVSTPPKSDPTTNVPESGRRLAVMQETSPIKPESAAAIETHLFEGRCVDATGRPVGDLSLILQDPEALDVSSGWLGKVGEGLEITPELIAQLKEGELSYVDYSGGHLSKSGIERLLAQMAYGTPMTVTLPDGSFSIKVPFAKAEFACESESLAIAGEGTHIQESGEEEQILVVSKRATLRGQVADEAGEPLEDAWVHVQLGLQYLPGFPMVLQRASDNTPRRATKTNATGEFHLEDIAYVPGMTIHASLIGYGYGQRTAPIEIPTRIDFVLKKDSPHPTVSGRVVGPTGAPVADATIRFTTYQTRTDLYGRFNFEVKREIAHMHDEEDLVAFAPGSAPAVMRNFGGRLKSDPSSGQDLYLQLKGSTGSIRGRVLDPTGNPLSDIEIHLLGGLTLPSTGEDVEELLASPWGVRTRTNSKGQFEIQGLFSESYGLSALDRNTFLAASVHDIVPGTEDVVIILAPSTQIAILRGRVTDEVGIGVSGAQLSSKFVVKDRHGRFGPSTISLDLGRTDAEGYFELADVPTSAVTLQVNGPHVKVKDVDISKWAAKAEKDEPLQVMVLVDLHFQLASDTVPGTSHYSIVDREGNPLHFRTRTPITTASLFGRCPIPKNRPLPTFIVGAKAVELILYADNTILRRIPLHLKRGEITQIH